MPSGVSHSTTSSRSIVNPASTDEARVDLRREAREERLCSEPLARPTRVVGLAEGREQPASRHEPAVNAREQGSEELAGHVVEDVEGCDGVQGACGQRELGEVRADEFRLRDGRASPLDLARRDVHARHGEPLRESPRLRRPAAAPELEEARTRLEARDELVLPLAARVADGPLAPRGERLADGVVAVGDELGARDRSRGEITVALLKVLLVTLHFPPGGGGGVHRPLKFATHLPALGIETHVLAPEPWRLRHRTRSSSCRRRRGSTASATSARAQRVLGGAARRKAGLARLGTQAALFGRRLLVPDENVPWSTFATAGRDSARAARGDRRRAHDLAAAARSTSSAPRSSGRPARPGSPTCATRSRRILTGAATSRGSRG